MELAQRGEKGDAARVVDYLKPRWDGTAGRLEVWYTTLTDRSTGVGVWLHHEVIAPSSGEAAFAHGWAAVFPVDGTPVCGRFGPVPVVGCSYLVGTAEGVSWELGVRGGGRPLFTFPRWAWRREILPTAHMVSAPVASFSGVVRCGDVVHRIDDGIGATARIYGHGNARRWCWLHADLGSGDVLEVVAGVSPRPVLRRLPPLVFLRLRVDGRDWPAGGVPLLGSRIGLPSWSVWGTIGRRRIRVEVRQPAERTVELRYREPDGSSPAVCRNSEVADADVVLERWRGRGGWYVERRWELRGTAHAEVGGWEGEGGR